MVESTGVWPLGLLDAYIALFPKADGDSAPLGQRPLCVLSVVYRLWASLRLSRLQGWVKGWVPESAFSVWNAVSSVEARFSTASDEEVVEEVLSGACDDQLRVLVADVIKCFEHGWTGLFWVALWDALGCPLASGRLISLIMIRSGSGLSWRRVYLSQSGSVKVQVGGWLR